MAVGKTLSFFREPARKTTIRLAGEVSADNFSLLPARQRLVVNGRRQSRLTSLI